MDLTYQRRMAADILKCGQNRVFMDPNYIEDISEAVTKDDVRKLIKSEAIHVKQKNGISKARTRHTAAQKRKGKRKGPGSRKGAKYARFPKKRRWIATIRPIRGMLKEMRADGTLDRSTYRTYYRHAKGGMYKNKGHMKAHMEAEGLLER